MANVRRWSPSYLLTIAMCTIPVVLLPQTTSHLTDPILAANASVPQNDSPGVPLRQLLANARAAAPAKGVVWKGLDLVVSDHEPVPPGESVTALLLRQYPKQACQADTIVIGHVSASAFHLSASQTSVYGDYLLMVDALLKDNAASSIRQKTDIVVTRPGGSISLPEGPVNYAPGSFPQLQPGATYLLFLRYIPQSSAFRALDSLSTLVANGNNWGIARKTYSGLAVPGFARGALEQSIGTWEASCQISK